MRRQRGDRGNLTIGWLVVRGSFTSDVVAVLRRLPPGQVMTYGEVAAEAGHPGAARAVGNVLRDVSGVPWWRVVAATGRVNPHDVPEASRRLRAEGVRVRDGRVIGRRQASGRPSPGDR